jgi:hypothetical protein
MIYMSMENDGGMILTGETEELGEKPVPDFVHQKPHLGENPGLRSEMPAIYRLSHGTAQLI